MSKSSIMRLSFSKKSEIDNYQEIPRLASRCFIRSDSLWQIYLYLHSLHDTVFFRGIAVDINRKKSLRPQVYEAAIENSQVIRSYIKKEHLSNDIDDPTALAIVMSENNHIIYKRGDTSGCVKIYPSNQSSIEPNIVCVNLYLDKTRTIDRIRKLLMMITIFLSASIVLISYVAFHHGLLKGYSSSSKKRSEEQKWEEQHSSMSDN